MLAALDATPPRIPVVIGGCGTGRTTLLHALADRMGRAQCQHVDIERAASTPSASITRSARVAVHGERPECRGGAGTGGSARAAFDRTLSLLTRARAGAEAPATFLLDEILELRTFESFPGLRHVLREMLHAMAESGNRFVLTTRYVARAHRLLRDAHARFEGDPLAAARRSGSHGDAAADGRDRAGRS